VLVEAAGAGGHGVAHGEEGDAAASVVQQPRQPRRAERRGLRHQQQHVRASGPP
jgi:hypothetical protein